MKLIIRWDILFRPSDYDYSQTLKLRAEVYLPDRPRVGETIQLGHIVPLVLPAHLCGYAKDSETVEIKPLGIVKLFEWIPKVDKPGVFDPVLFLENADISDIRSTMGQFCAVSIDFKGIILKEKILAWVRSLSTIRFSEV